MQSSVNKCCANVIKCYVNISLLYIWLSARAQQLVCVCDNHGECEPCSTRAFSDFSSMMGYAYGNYSRNTVMWLVITPTWRIVASVSRMSGRMQLCQEQATFYTRVLYNFAYWSQWSVLTRLLRLGIFLFTCQSAPTFIILGWFPGIRLLSWWFLSLLFRLVPVYSSAKYRLWRIPHTPPPPTPNMWFYPGVLLWSHHQPIQTVGSVVIVIK